MEPDAASSSRSSWIPESFTRWWQAFWQVVLSWGYLPWSLLLLILLTTLGLQHLPHGFSASEAAPLVLAADLLENDLHSSRNILLPAFFELDHTLDFGTRVYLLLLPYISFGRHIWVVRGLSVLAALVSAVFLSLTLQTFFQVVRHWLVFLVLAAAPGFLLLARQGNNAVLMLAFASVAFYFYLQYRFSNPRRLLPAVVFIALIFYTDFAGQVIALAAAILFLLVDLPYHRQQRRYSLPAIGLAVFLALPWLRYSLMQGADYLRLWQSLQPAWSADNSLAENLIASLLAFFNLYNPRFWFLPPHPTGIRSPALYLGILPYFLPLFIPFLLVGIYTGIRHLSKQPAQRYLWLSLLFMPLPLLFFNLNLLTGALFLIPLTIWTVTGWQTVFDHFLSHRVRLSDRISFSFLTLLAIVLALVTVFNSRSWLAPFPLHKTPFGTAEIFSTVEELSTRQRKVKFALSTTWSDHPEILQRFFTPRLNNIEFNLLSSFEENARQDIADYIFILDQADLERVFSSNKFAGGSTIKTIYTPAARPAYYFVRLNYAPHIQEILDAEIEKRRQLSSTDLDWQGHTLTVRYPALEIGPVNNLFDDDPNTLVKSDSLNPLNLEILFSHPVSLEGIHFLAGVEPLTITVTLIGPQDQPLITFNQNEPRANANRLVHLDFSQSYLVKSLLIFIHDQGAPSGAPVHLWEIQFLEIPDQS